MNAPKPKLTSALLREFLSYDAETGHLYWKKRHVRWFASGKQTAEHNAAIWNGRYAGKRAFTALDANGYASGRVFGKTYHGHRIIWCILHGEFPTDDVDHINGVRSDNRECNLRPVNRTQNSQNSALRSDNRSGRVGVRWYEPRNKWSARITKDGVETHLGYFDSFALACKARSDAEREHGFHENHGRRN